MLAKAQNKKIKVKTDG